uniref:SmpA / OmlA family protein n=1 Tax=Candidatus Kentrum sp. LFY TaxID=2126342 RepID=A0A450V2U6_9GAMM|nr:MAG: SmpA / OmlA family protein [Candidatus Kentron sp. LFY]VFK21689.1 MAG: SmpA / OmlA family protein [Candidatus Kentron sp. LFY]
MQRQIRHFVVLAMITLLAGCAVSKGQAFDVSYVNKIEPGMTTKADIRKNLGEPHSTTLSSKTEVWTYQHFRGGSFFENVKGVYGAAPIKAEIDTLEIFFKDDIVKDYSFKRDR